VHTISDLISTYDELMTKIGLAIQSDETENLTELDSMIVANWNMIITLSPSSESERIIMLEFLLDLLVDIQEPCDTSESIKKKVLGLITTAI